VSGGFGRDVTTVRAVLERRRTKINEESERWAPTDDVSTPERVAGVQKLIWFSIEKYSGGLLGGL